jgi:hypothetical protein
MAFPNTLAFSDISDHPNTNAFPNTKASAPTYAV